MNCLRCNKPLDGRQSRFCSINCKNSHHVTEWRRRTKLRAVAYKGGKCQKCGYDRCAGALTFHHRDPSQKEFRIGSGAPKKWERLVAELDKCDLLCANCHHEEHWVAGEIADGRDRRLDTLVFWRVPRPAKSVRRVRFPCVSL